ncbi:MAG TPA: MFS transporter [Casimicrobiaceae bacterium]|jgi:DHA2 family methylenomycin A resistance protein-like MFS transporter
MPAAPYLGSPRSKSLTLIATSLGFAVVQLDVTIVNTALNAISSALGGGVVALQWIVSTYTITFASFILTAGALGDRLGSKRIFIAGFAIFTIASLACAIAPNLPILIAARAVQGIGAAILVPNSLAVLNHAHRDEKERARAVGIWAAGASFSITAGPLAGGALIAAFGWRSIFLVNLPVGLVGLWLAWQHVAETPSSRKRALDLPGQALAILGLGSLAAAMIEGGAVGWTNRWVIASFATFVVLLILFLSTERRARDPMLPLSLFSRRRFTITSVVGLLVNVACYGLIFVLSLYFQRENGYTALETGLAFAPMMIAVFIANLAAARLAARYGARITIGAGAALAALSCAALLGIGRGTPYAFICAQFIALGLGLGVLVPPLTSMLLGSVEKARSGVASGALNSARQTGSVIGVSLFGSLIGGSLGLVSGTRWALSISIALLAGACVAMLVGDNRDARVASRAR